MLMEWLEPTIQKRTLEITREFENQMEETRDRFDKIIKLFKDNLTNDYQGQIDELENIFNDVTGLQIAFGYRNGFNEALLLGKDIYNGQKPR